MTNPTCVLALALGLLGVAPQLVAADDAPMTYSACLKNGSLVSVAIGDEPAQPCKPSEELVQWNSSGQDGDDGATWYSGATLPTSTLGADGDLYLLRGDVGAASAGDVFVKDAGTWVTRANLSGPEGPQGAPGADGDDGATWYSGATLPAPTLGADGDFYLLLGDVGADSAGDVFVKDAGTWVTRANLSGPEGPQGRPGADGADGEDGVTEALYRQQLGSPVEVDGDDQLISELPLDAGSYQVMVSFDIELTATDPDDGGGRCRIVEAGVPGDRARGTWRSSLNDAQGHLSRLVVHGVLVGVITLSEAGALQLRCDDLSTRSIPGGFFEVSPPRWFTTSVGSAGNGGNLPAPGG